MKNYCAVLLVLAGAAPLQYVTAQTPDAAEAPLSLTSLQVGARLRVTDTTLRSYEGRLALRLDSILYLELRNSLPHRRIGISEIRTLEVHAAPGSRQRTILVSTGAGIIIGAIAGAAVHGAARASPGMGSAPNRAENIAVGSVYGGAIGWALGRYVFSRPRWQPVRF